jgi:hypothetical protein
MDKWVDQLNSRAQILIDQVISARLAGQQTGQDMSWLERQFREKIERLYAEEYASANLRDNSDLVLRAEGPGTDHFSPSLHSFNWMADHVNRQLGKLSVSVLPLAVDDAKRAAKRLKWAFTGYAPGSIMMGFALKQPDSLAGFEESDRLAFTAVSESAQAIASIPQFIGNTEIDASIIERIPDPALRDSAVMAAWYLSPTPQSGIHTIEVASKLGDHGSLSQRERMVLKTVIDNPDLRQKRQGSFVGSLRAADLDKHRAVLRDVNGLESPIRCILDDKMDSHLKFCFGSRVKVSGIYETDREGRPRLMYVNHLEPDNSQATIV